MWQVLVFEKIGSQRDILREWRKDGETPDPIPNSEAKPVQADVSPHGLKQANAKTYKGQRANTYRINQREDEKEKIDKGRKESEIV